MVSVVSQYPGGQIDVGWWVTDDYIRVELAAAFWEVGRLALEAAAEIGATAKEVELKSDNRPDP